MSRFEISIVDKEQGIMRKLELNEECSIMIDTGLCHFYKLHHGHFNFDREFEKEEIERWEAIRQYKKDLEDKKI